MPKKVEILSQRETYRYGFIHMEEATLRHELFDGTMTTPFTRVALVRGDSVAVVVHHPERQILVMTEQFRYPAHLQGKAWLLEIPAGVINDGETPEITARREVEEEIGYRLEALEHISTFFVSPGGTSERIHLYYAQVTPRDQVGMGGGRKSESEFIKVHHVRVEDARAKVKSGEICDAKTLIGLQWLELRSK